MHLLNVTPATSLLKSFATLQGFAEIVATFAKRQEQIMSDENGFAQTPLGQSVFFAYVEAYAKKHNITREEAIIQLSNGDNNE